MDDAINPPELRSRSFGVYDPFTASPGGAAEVFQVGEGFFSFLNIFKTLLPLFKSGIKAIIPAAKTALRSPAAKKIAANLRDQAVEAGLNVAVNALKGDSVPEGLKKNLQTARETTAANLETLLPDKQKEKKARKRKKSPGRMPVYSAIISKKKKNAKPSARMKKRADLFT